jgi:DUF1009 family protein
MSAPRHAARQGRLAIVAGAGRLPYDVAVAARKAGDEPFIVALAADVDRDWSDFEHVEIGTGDFAALDRAFREHEIGRVVLSGGVRRRPEWRDIRPTLRHILKVPAVLRILLGSGDDAVLRMVIELIEGNGYRVVGAHEIVPGLLAELGPITKAVPDDVDWKDIAIGQKAALALGTLDVGQGAVVVGGRIVALEGVEGTDAMLRRVADLRAEGRISDRRRGVLVKCCKPRQEERADLPSVGLSTVENASAAGLAGIAVEAGRALVLDRERMIAAADKMGIFVVGISCETEAVR